MERTTRRGRSISKPPRKSVGKRSGGNARRGLKQRRPRAQFASLRTLINVPIRAAASDAALFLRGRSTDGVFGGSSSGDHPPHVRGRTVLRVSSPKVPEDCDGELFSSGREDTLHSPYKTRARPAM